MPLPLPARPNLEWLKKQAKDHLAALRSSEPAAKLSDAQLAVAREYGFPSWRKLKEHVDSVNKEAEASVAPGANTSLAVVPDDPELAQLLGAVDAGNLDVAAELLKRRPALAAAHGPQGQTPLHVAAQCNDPRLGLLLLAYGADAQARYGESGHTPLSWAITCNALEFARTFVRLGIKPDLFCAAGVGSLEHVQAWFDESGQLKPGASDTGSSRYSPDGTRLPCPPSNASEQISDALYIACRNHHTDVVRFLLTKRPDLSFRAYLGGTPLHWAYYSGGGTEIIDLLHRAGADTTARDDVYRCLSREWSMIAPAGMGIPGIVRARLAVDPALANTPGARTSPLHEATRIGHAEIVRLLLDAGADPTYRNDEGQTPLELARSHPATGYPAVIELLQAAARRDS